MKTIKIATNTYLIIITLKVSGLNALIKNTEWQKGFKTRPTYMLSKKDSLQIWRQVQTKSEGMGKVFHANGNKKKGGIVILISEKIDPSTKTVTSDKEGY